MADAPSLAAVSTAAARSAGAEDSASTSRIRQAGQPALTISTSRALSKAHPESVIGKGAASPFWFTFVKQPFAVVQGARPYWVR
jgi:hypothetical protein